MRASGSIRGGEFTRVQLANEKRLHYSCADAERKGLSYIKRSVVRSEMALGRGARRKWVLRGTEGRKNGNATAMGNWKDVVTWARCLFRDFL